MLLISVASVRNVYFLSVTSVGRYLWSACRIAFCAILVCWFWFIISSVVDCQPLYHFYQCIRFNLLLTCQDCVFILYLCIGCLTEGIHSYTMGIQNFVIGIRFLFCNDSIYFISNIIIGKWYIVAIIVICYGPERLCMNGFQHKTSPFSKHHLINVKHKVLSQLSQPMSIYFRI